MRLVVVGFSGLRARKFTVEGLVVVGFILVHVSSFVVVFRCIRVRVGSIARARCRRIDSGLGGFTWARLVVLRFIAIRVRSLRR